MSFFNAVGSAFGSSAVGSIGSGANNWFRSATSRWESTPYAKAIGRSASFGRWDGSIGIEQAHKDASWNDYRYAADQSLDYAKNYYSKMYPELAMMESNADLRAKKTALLNNGYNPILAINGGASAQQASMPQQPRSDNSSARNVSSDPTALAAIENLFAQNSNLKQQNGVIKADRELKEAQAWATRENAETAKWDIKDAKSVGAAGFEVMRVGASGKREIIQTIRINKVTGAVYDALTGKRVDIIGTIDNSAKSTPSVTNNYQYNHYSNGELPNEYKNKGNPRDWRSINE